MNNMLGYAAMVFLGGASYGVMAVAIKLSLAQGFDWTQNAASQPLFGVAVFAAALAISVLFGRKPRFPSGKTALQLVGLGLTTCTTCVLYNFALTMLPVSVAITLLFQFTWIGVIIQVITTRKPPSASEVIAIVVILAGTLLASGLLFEGENLGKLNPVGLLCALLSAVSVALFMFFSSFTGKGVPFLERGLITCLGACILGFSVCPGYFASGCLADGIWVYGLVLGIFALFVPVTLFGIATPHLPAGISTIMAASELPCGIVMTMLIVGEYVSPMQLLGVAIILIGVVLSQLPSLIALRSRNCEVH